MSQDESQQEYTEVLRTSTGTKQQNISPWSVQEKRVISLLRWGQTKLFPQGQRLVKVEIEDHPSLPRHYVCTPSNRQRLDHYGNDGEGWDETGWEENYVTPLINNVQRQLDHHFPSDTFRLEVGEKGYLYIYRNE